MDVSGWKISGGIDFTIPVSTSIPAGGYKVIAKTPAGIQTVYGITGVLGPFVESLSNKDDTVRLKDAANNIIDSVSYSRSFPRPTSEDALKENGSVRNGIKLRAIWDVKALKVGACGG